GHPCNWRGQPGTLRRTVLSCAWCGAYVCEVQQNHVPAIIPDLREILIRRALVLTVRRSKGTLFADPTNNDCSATEQGDAMKDRLGSVQACTRAHHLVLTAAVLIPAALLSCKVHAGGFDARYV